MTTLLFNEVERLYQMVASGTASPEMKLLSSLLGTGEEADEWLGYSGFWVEGGPKVVEDAIDRLPIELQEGLWWDALDSAVTIRSLQLIRLATCYSGNKKIPSMPSIPIPESWVAPDTVSSKLGIHVDVCPISESSDPCWSDLIICVTVGSKVELKVVSSDVRLSSKFVATHPDFRQSKKGRTLTATNGRSGGSVDALVVGKVRYYGHCSATITDSTITLTTDSGLDFLKRYISEMLQLSEHDVSVSHKRGSIINIWFPRSSEPKKLQLQLMHLHSDYWDQVWECGSETPDLQVQFPGRPCIKIAVSGREGSSPFVSDEILRQSVLAIMENREIGWKEEVVGKITNSGSTSQFSRELLWCVAGGSVDVTDPYEIEAMVSSIREQRYVPNRKPKFCLSSTPHKSHELFKKNRTRLRDGITHLHSKLIASLPFVDPITAEQMGIFPPADVYQGTHQTVSFNNNKDIIEPM